MFITSRESAIVRVPFHRIAPCRSRFPRPAGELGRKLPAPISLRVNFGDPSIAQPGNGLPASKSPGFSGFYGGFLEADRGTVETCVYMLGYELDRTAYMAAVMLKAVISDANHNQST